MLQIHVIWQTDLKPLSGTNAKNGAITPSLTPTMHTSHARCDKASEWVGGSLQCKRGILVILWMSLVDVAVGGLVTCMSTKIYTLRGCKLCLLGWCCVFVTMLPDTIEDSSTSTRSLYLRSSQLCLIKRMRDFKELSYLNLWYSYSSFF